MADGLLDRVRPTRSHPSTHSYMKHNRFLFAFAAGVLSIGTSAAQTPTQFQWENSDPTFASNTVLAPPLLSNVVGNFIAAADVDGDNDVDFISGLNYFEN